MMFSFLKPVARFTASKGGLVILLALLLSACSAATSATPTPTPQVNAHICGPGCNPPVNTPRPSPTATPTPQLLVDPSYVKVPGSCNSQSLSNGDTQYTCFVTLYALVTDKYLFSWSLSQITPPGSAQVSPTWGTLFGNDYPSESITITLDRSVIQRVGQVMVSITSRYNPVNIVLSL